MSRVKSGGDKGHKLLVTCTPSSAFKSTIDGYTDPRDAIGKLVTIADGYVVSLVGDNVVPNGRVEAIEGTKETGYTLTVHLFALNSQNSNNGWFCPTVIVNMPYSGTLAFGDTIQANGTDGVNVDDAGATAGAGFVLAVDNPVSGYADVAF